ncbi:hypothetical protein SDC9_173475 [bioreactor metagenome]|uniref:Uncharacterized protein n=1 Tax=bioreactor metagenome TaxID=1076179 RepID=A0A645GQV0_9ZZZZ
MLDHHPSFFIAVAIVATQLAASDLFKQNFVGFASEFEFVGRVETHRQQRRGGKDHQSDNSVERAFRLCAAAFYKARLFQHHADKQNSDCHGTFAGEYHNACKNPFTALLGNHFVDIRNKAVDIPWDIVKAGTRHTE